MERSVIWIVFLCFMVFSHGESLPNNQPYRTAYHFQPPKNWMNGPMYYNGIYHLFYQYNPYAAVWGNITWAHSISYDLVNWIHIDHAIVPSDPFDIMGCWSGSATILPGEKLAILYTGVNIENHQVQNLAVPKNLSDPFLTEWIKSSRNPLMTPSGIAPNSFRDPTTAWVGPDGEFRIIIGSQIDGHGTATLYKSRDFVTWTWSVNPLHFSNKTEMWECPDFYPVSINGTNGLDTSVQGEDTKHVLKASFNNHDYYIIGDYDPREDKYMVDIDFMDNETQFRYDYGMFYASKSFYDSAKERRILWGWIAEADAQSDDIQKGWSGLQSIPRSILLDATGKQLVQWPVKEFEKLRGEQVTIHDKALESGSVLEIRGVTASQADVEVEFQLSNFEGAEIINNTLLDPQVLCNQNKAATRGVIGPFGLLVLASSNLTEQTAIFFRIFKARDKYIVLMCSDQSRASLRNEVDKRNYGAFMEIDPIRENISLRSLIDHSIVESFGGKGKTCITTRVYPLLAIDKEAHLYAFNNGTNSITISSLSAWSMKKAQMAPIGRRRRKRPTN